MKIQKKSRRRWTGVITNKKKTLEGNKKLTAGAKGNRYIEPGKTNFRKSDQIIEKCNHNWSRDCPR